MTTNGARDRPGGGGESPTIVPEHVATWPGWSDRKGTRRVRSSWRSGRMKSASSTVRSPFRSSWAARRRPPPTADLQHLLLLLFLRRLLLHLGSHLLSFWDSPRQRRQ